MDVVKLTVNLRKKTIRLRADKQGGITVADCIQMTHAINDYLRAENWDPDEFDVEVSSAGLDRPLSTLKDYHQYIGALARVTLTEEQDGRTTMVGRIQGTEDPDIIMFEEERQGALRIRLEEIRSARLIPELK